MATRRTTRGAHDSKSTGSTTGGTNGHKICRHVSGIFSDRAQATIHQPDRWVCSTKDCGTSGGGRLCLTCGLCFCSKHAKGHANDNARGVHPLSIELNSEAKQVHCYDCNMVVHNDNPKGELFLIREWIVQVQNLTTDTTGRRGNDGRSPSLLALPYLSKEAQARRSKEDLIRTAIYRWRSLLIAKCFNSWKDYKRDRSHDTTSDNKDNDSTGVQSMDDSEPVIAVVKATPPRRRGRPPKVKDTTTDNGDAKTEQSSSSSSSSSSASSSAAASPSVTGRKRGRPANILVPSRKSARSSKKKSDNNNSDAKSSSDAATSDDNEGDDSDSDGEGDASSDDDNDNGGDEKEAKRARKNISSDNGPGEAKAAPPRGRPRGRARKAAAAAVPSTPTTPSAARVAELAEELRRRARSTKDDHSVSLPSDTKSGGTARRRSLITSPGVCGLRNLGNTCYMNSVLQAFSNALYFRRYFSEHFPSLKSKKDDTKLELSENVSNLMSRLWDGKRSFFTPDDMLQTVWKMCRQFMGFKQQDAQEFTLFVLNQLSKEQPLGHLSDLPLPFARPVVNITTDTITAGAAASSSSSSSTVDSSSASSSSSSSDVHNTPRRSRRRSKDETELSDIGAGAVASSSAAAASPAAAAAAATPGPPKPQLEARPDDFIVQQFGGTLRNSVECKSCGFHSNTDTDLLGIIGLQIPHTPLPGDGTTTEAKRGRGRGRRGSAAAATTTTVAPSRGTARKGAKKIPPATFSLKECLDYTYCSPEELTGDNQYHCAKCKTKVDAIKRYSISALPARYLILHLMRTEFDPRTGNPSKNPSRVVFPLRGLDMAPILEASHSATGTSSNGTRTKKRRGSRGYAIEGDNDYVYDLFAAVVHHGRGMNEGHFTAYCYFKEQEKWLLYNDANVTVADVKEVEESQAYLLFYERRHATEDIDPNDTDNDNTAAAAASSSSTASAPLSSPVLRSHRATAAADAPAPIDLNAAISSHDNTIVSP